MASLRAIVATLRDAARRGEPVVLASVVRVVGSSYGGVGARMVVRVDGGVVGLVSGGCLESDLALHARRVHESGRAATITYDTRADDDAVWGLGLGCNGLIDVLLEPLRPEEAERTAALLARALEGDEPAVLATVVGASATAPGAPRVGSRALLGDRAADAHTGDWGDGSARLAADAGRAEALASGRRGLMVEHDETVIALEVVHPAVRLLVCGSGPDAVPVARFGVQLGWDVTVVDHRPATPQSTERFPGAVVAECRDATRLAEAVSLSRRTAAVVMSHHFARDTDYVQALLAARVHYVGVLGPRSRTERILAELAERECAPSDEHAARLHGPVGLDLGGEGPDAIALAIVSEVAAVSARRSGRPLRDVALEGSRPAKSPMRSS